MDISIYFEPAEVGDFVTSNDQQANRLGDYILSYMKENPFPDMDDIQRKNPKETTYLDDYSLWNIPYKLYTFPSGRFKRDHRTCLPLYFSQ